MKLIETFSQGNIPDFNAPPQKTIETYISKLFFSKDTVVKIYKNKKYFFADLKNLKTRHQFYQEDFLWNNKMSPSIYLKLQGMRQQKNNWQKSSLLSAQDFYIKMRRIDDTKNLTNLLLSKKTTPRHLSSMAMTMVTKINQLAKERQSFLNRLRKKWSWSKFETLDLADCKSWAYSAHPNLPRSRTNTIVDRLAKARRLLPYFQNLNMSDMTFAVDSQSDNILILGNNVEFLDIMPPKESWHIQDIFLTVTRPATDTAVLDSTAKAKAIYNTFAKHNPLPPPEVRTVYEIKSALIKTAYMYALNKPTLAKKYLAYIDKLLPQLPQ
jgi:hypothetical protein